MSVHGRTGEGNHHFGYGGGFTASLSSAGPLGIPTPQAGYRYQRPDGGFFFRATALAMVLLDEETEAVPFVGLSFGFTE